VFPGQQSAGACPGFLLLCTSPSDFSLLGTPFLRVSTALALVVSGVSRRHCAVNWQQGLAAAAASQVRQHPMGAAICQNTHPRPFGPAVAPKRTPRTCRQGGSTSSRQHCSSHSLLARAVPADQLDYWDVVEYKYQQQQQPGSPSETLRLGLVQQVCVTGVKCWGPTAAAHAPRPTLQMSHPRGHT
jgi:hypothetical protein